MQLKRTVYNAIAGALIGAWLLSACAPTATTTPAGPGPTAAASQPPATQPPATQPVTATTTAGQPVEVQFWHVYSAGSAQGTEMDALIAEFNAANPDVKVVGTYQGSYPDMYKKVTAAIPGKSLPDAAVSYANDIANYILSGAPVKPLDAQLSDPQDGFSADDLKDIFPSYIDHYPGSNNQVMSVAYNRSMEVMYYNADLLKAAGINQPPATWDDFMTDCAAVSKPPDVYCYAVAPDASRFSNWVWSRGGTLLAPDSKSVTFQKEGLDALQFLKTLMDKNYAYLVAKQFGDQSDFAVQKAVFTFGSSAGIPFYDKAVTDSGKPFEWSVAPMPHTTADPVVDVYGPSVAIFQSTPEKELATWRFIKFLMSTDVNAKWAEATAYFPARQSAFDQLKDYMSAHPKYAAVVSALPYGKTEPQIAPWTKIRGLLADAITAVATGTSGPDDAINTAVDQANTELSK
jgi:ABC-type glycerol-3-phosphate transport system substrate-binding protein